MKSISLFVDNGTYLTRVHPFTKLMYIAAAISIPLISGRLWMFGVFIAVSLLVLASGKILKKTLPLIAFSFTILLTIFLIHGLFNQKNVNVLFQVVGLKFYREGIFYALHIGLNILNMLLSFAVFVLSTKPSEFVDELEKTGIFPTVRLHCDLSIPDHPADDGNDEYYHGCPAQPRTGDRRKFENPREGISAPDLPCGHEFPDQYQRACHCPGGAWFWRRKEKNLADRADTP